MEWYFALPLAIAIGLFWAVQDYIIGCILSPSNEEKEPKK